MKKTYRKLTVAISIILLISISLTSCTGDVSNGLLDEASPETSALELFYFDGDVVSSLFLFEQELVEEVLAKLDGVPTSAATDWSLEDITLPLYGFSIGGVTGWSVNAAWSNGYWITGEGNAYTFDFDFETLDDYPWEEARTFTSFISFPNARILTQDGEQWNSTLLTIADITTLPGETEGITITLEDLNREVITATIANENNVEWMYGQRFDLHVLIDGVWYHVPPLPDWSFTDEGLIVPAHGEVEHVYHMGMFGDLPNGTYRIVSYGVYVEFDLL
jgi:hypothetical protein